MDPGNGGGGGGVDCADMNPVSQHKQCIQLGLQS